LLPRRALALSSRATLAAVLETIARRRSARVLAGPLRREVGETIRAALLYADLRSFTALSSQASCGGDRGAGRLVRCIAGAVHAFGGEVLKFIGDGVRQSFGGRRSHIKPAMPRCAPSFGAEWRISMSSGGSRAAPWRSASHCIGEILWGNVGAADRLVHRDRPRRQSGDRLEGFAGLRASGPGVRRRRRRNRRR
jgi:class 3 adenylate cyclase